MRLQLGSVTQPDQLEQFFGRLATHLRRRAGEFKPELDVLARGTPVQEVRMLKDEAAVAPGAGYVLPSTRIVPES